MSRGHGVRQRQLLERIAGADHRGRYVTPAGSTPAEAAALRRAAYQLELEGLLQLRVSRGRLAMWRPDAEPALPDTFITGLDGRRYRAPHGERREDYEERREGDRLHREMLDRYEPIAEAHGHPHGPGIRLCYECAESAGADADLLARLR